MEKLKSLLTVPYKQENYKQFTADFLNDMEAVPLQEQDECCIFLSLLPFWDY